MTALAPPRLEGKAGTPVTAVSLPDRRAAGGRPQAGLEMEGRKESHRHLVTSCWPLPCERTHRRPLTSGDASIMPPTLASCVVACRLLSSGCRLFAACSPPMGSAHWRPSGPRTMGLWLSCHSAKSMCATRPPMRLLRPAISSSGSATTAPSHQGCRRSRPDAAANRHRNLPPRLQPQCPGGQAVTRFDLKPGFSHDEAAQPELR